jgi:hypothetical protein
LQGRLPSLESPFPFRDAACHKWMVPFVIDWWVKTLSSLCNFCLRALRHFVLAAIHHRLARINGKDIQVRSLKTLVFQSKNKFGLAGFNATT